MKSSHGWQLGDICLAQARGWCFWPARIVEVKRRRYVVEFFDPDEWYVKFSKWEVITNQYSSTNAVVSGDAIHPIYHGLPMQISADLLKKYPTLERRLSMSYRMAREEQEHANEKKFKEEGFIPYAIK